MGTLGMTALTLRGLYRVKMPVESSYTSQWARPGDSTLVRYLIRRYLSGVQRRPDRSASWHDRHPPVRPRSSGVGSRSPK